MAENALRMRRLLSPSGHMRMVPLDHGVSVGPIQGIGSPVETLSKVAGAQQLADGTGATCVTVHKGLARHTHATPPGLGVLLHLSASTDVAPDPHDKRLVATVEEAVRLGCDGVSTHVNVGSATEARQLEEMGHVSTACQEWGMPLVAMMYVRGPSIKDPRDPTLVAHAARLGAELGADLVKVPFTTPSTFREVVQGATVPVVVAGGPTRDSFEAVLKDLQAAKKAGARGVSIGRNVFQNPEPSKALAAIARVFQ